MSCIRPCTGRIASCTRQCTGHVYGVFGRVHWLCTLPFSAVYIARTRPCNSPCTRSLDGRVQGSSGKCIRQVGQQGRAHVPRRHATAVCCPLRHTVRVRDVDEHVHGCVWDVYTTVYMAGYGRVRGPRPQRAVSARVHGRVGLPAMYTTVYWPCTRTCTWRVHGPLTAV